MLSKVISLAKGSGQGASDASGSSRAGGNSKKSATVDPRNMTHEALYQHELNHETKLLYTTNIQTRLKGESSGVRIET